MCVKKLLVSLTFVAISTFSSNPANAISTEYTGSRLINLSSGDKPDNHFLVDPTDAVSIGDSGDYVFSLGKSKIMGASFIGVLPQDSMITFSYSSQNAIEGLGLAKAFGSYYYDNGEHKFYGSKLALSSGHKVEGYAVDGNPSTNPLVFVTAQLDDASTTSRATATIKNISAGGVFFESSFSQLFGLFTKTGNITVHYDVSVVPLPAALPMFGLGLAGIAGLRRRKTRKAAAA